MQSVGNKGPETVKTEIHLITVELPCTLPCLCWNMFSEQYNYKASKYQGEVWSRLSPLCNFYIKI